MKIKNDNNKEKKALINDNSSNNISLNSTLKNQKNEVIIISNSLFKIFKKGKTINVIIKNIHSSIPIITIGPDIIPAISFFFIILILCLVVHYFVICKGYRNYPRITFWWRICFLEVMTVFVLTCIINPGICLQEEIKKDSNENYKDENYCDTCEAYRDPKTYHCGICNVCIKKYDHHCVLTSKCIGGYNIILFYLFLISAIGLYGYTIVLVIMFIFWRKK